MPACQSAPAIRLLRLLTALLALPLFITGLLLALLLWLPQLLPYALKPFDIQLHLEAPRWQARSLQLERLELRHPDWQLQARQLRLSWQWQLRRPLQQLQLAELHVSMPWQTQDESATGSFQPPAWLANSLPRQLQLDQARIELTGLLTAEGRLMLAGDTDTPLWLPTQLELDAWLEPGQLPLLPGLSPDDLPKRLQFVTRSHKPADEETLNTAIQVLDLQLRSPDNNLLALQGVLSLYDQPEPSLRLDHARLELQLPRLELDDLQARQLAVSADFQLDSNRQQTRLNLLAPARISASQLRLDADSLLHQPALELTRLTLQANHADNPPTLTLHTRYQASTSNLQHELLKPQQWTVQGELDLGEAGLQASAHIKSSYGLQADSQWRWQHQQLSGNIQLADLYLRGGNALQQSLKDWPALLELDSGRLTATATLSQNAGQPLLFQSQFNASGVSGIFDRSEFKQMNLQGSARLQADQLRLDISRLTIDSLDPGIPLTDLNLQTLAYQGRPDDLENGRLSWQQLGGELLGGQFALPAQQLRMADNPAIPLTLQGIQLQEALTLYPTEGLDGQATLDGIIPLRIGSQGVFVEQGQLQARQPGILRFQSDQIRSLGKSNPGMQIVAEALDDFHFNLLSTRLDYEPSGQLLLNVRLEGKNPAVENGRPIHLNLNIEEDLPALLGSIQLSNHVSETIQQRIRQRLQNR